MSMKKLARKLWTGRSSREVQQSLFRRRPLFEALERRYLMSAELLVPPPPPASDQAPVVAPADPAAGAQGKKPSAPGSHPYLVERAAFKAVTQHSEMLTLEQYAKANATRQGDAKAWLPGQEASQPKPAANIPGYTTNSEQTPVRQIIFVDPAVDNAEQIVQGLYGLISGKTEGLDGLARPTGDGPQLQVLRSHDTEIIVLDGRYDGVDQITQVLGQHQDLAAVQIMSHGSVGSLKLGTATLGSGQLDAYKDQLRAWGDAMSEDGDILLYGCNVAAGRGGIAFVDSLAAITRADVAAATHTVGSAALGGDWVLDYRHGAIEAGTVTVASWNGVMASATGLQSGGSTLQGVAVNDHLIGYGSNNTFVFDNNSTAAVTTIEVRQGMKLDNGVWVRNEDDDNSNNTLDFSGIRGNVTAIISNNDAYQITYSTVDAGNNWTQRVVNVVFKSADGSQNLKIGDKTFNLIGTAQSGKTILDYSGYATGVTVDLSGPTADANGEEIPPPPPTGFGYVRAISGVKGSTQGGNRITVVGDTTVTINSSQDIIKGSGGGNTYIAAAGTLGFNLTQQAGQSGNTLDLSQFGADVTARVQTGGGISVYMGAGVAADGSVNGLAAALVSNLDVQMFFGVAGRTTLDYSAYEDNVTVNLNFQDGNTGLYDASGLGGVLNISNVIGAGGDYGNDIVGSLGDNIITVANSRGQNRISGGGGNDLVIGNLAAGGATEYIAGVESNASLSGDKTSATLTNTPLGAGAASTVTLRGVNAVTLQDYRTIDAAAAAGSAYHAATSVTLDGTNYRGDLTLIGSAGANVLLGGLGHNTFTGYQGANQLWAQAGAQSNTLDENGQWNFTLTNNQLSASYASDGTPLGAGVPVPTLSNTLNGAFSDARLNGGLGSTLIDASAFSGNTVLVSGLMAGGVIRAGSGDNTRHQIMLLGGRYNLYGGTGANAATELVVAADGLTGTDGAGYQSQMAASGGVGYVSFQQTGATGWIQRTANETQATASTYAGISSVRVISGEYGNWIDTSRFAGTAVLDGIAGLSNYFIISNAYATQVIGSAGSNTIELSTGGKSVALDNSQVKIGSGGAQISSVHTNVKDFRFVVEGSSANTVDTTAYTGVTTRTYLSDLTSGYTPAEGPALAFVFPNHGNARVDVGLEGVRTIQDLLDAIGAGIMVNAAGEPLRVAVGGPNAGKLIPASDSTTPWDYLYALTASLDGQGRLQIRYSQDAIAAGYSGAFSLAPGMQAALNADGTVSNSTVSLSDAAYKLGLIAAGQVQSSSDGAGVLTGAALAIGHQTQFVLAGSNSTIRSGGGDNTFVVNYGQGGLNTGAGNSIAAQAGARNSLVVNTSVGAVLSNTNVHFVSGGSAASQVALNGGVFADATVISTSSTGATTLDASAWTQAVTLGSSGGYDTLKGNTNNVSFMVTQPADTAGGTVTVTLASNSGSGNSLQVMALGGSAALSNLISTTGTIAGVTLGANTNKLDYVLDIGSGALDQALTVSGRNVIIRGQSYSVLHNITLDAGYALRLEGEKITVGATSGANIVLAAGAVELAAQRYRPWRSAVAQIYKLDAAITINNATLWAKDTGGSGVSLTSKIDSKDYDLDPLIKNGANQGGVLGTLAGGVNSAFDALMKFLDGAGAMAAWAGIEYNSSIKVGAQARLVSNGDVTITSTTSATVKLSPLVAKIAGIAVGVLQNKSTIDVQGTVIASRSITIKSDLTNEMEIALLPGQIGAVPAVIGVGVAVVISESSVHIGTGARLETGLLHTANPDTGTVSGVGGDVTIQALTSHKSTISISAAGAMAESDDTKPVTGADGKIDPSKETGKYKAGYAKVGVAVGFAYNQLTTEAYMDGTVVTRNAGKVTVEAKAQDAGSAIAVKTILGGRAATGSDFLTSAQTEAKNAAIAKTVSPIVGGALGGLGTGVQYVKSFFSALVSESRGGKFGAKIKEIKQEKDFEDRAKYDSDIQKEIDNPSTEFQVGAALGMAMNNITTTARIGNGVVAATVNTAGGDVTVKAQTQYNTRLTIMSGVDDQAIADKQAFLNKKNNLTTNQPERAPGPDGSDFGAAAAVVIGIDDVATRATVSQLAAINTQGGDVAVTANTLNQIDPMKLWLVNLYAPFDGINAKWNDADGTKAKAEVAGKAAASFLNNLQATLTSTGGISSSFSSWASATAKSKKLALSGAFTVLVQDTKTQAQVAGKINTTLSGGTAGDVTVQAENSSQRLNLVGNIILPSISLGGAKSLQQAAPRGAAESRYSYGKDRVKGFLTPKFQGFDYGSSSKEGSAIGVSVYVNAAKHDTRAVVSDTAEINSGKLTVDADNELISVTLGASGGQAKSLALNGVVLVNSTSATTLAQVGRGARIAAAGAADIQATDATWVGTVAGAAAGSQAVGVGMSVSINDVNRWTQALIGDTLRVADGAPTGLPVGSFSAASLTIRAENKGFVGNLAVAGSRVSSPVAGAGGGTGAGAGGTGG
ncbi:DUF4347 domain-containing protein, partial [Achromobacter xylosoxidans]